MGPLLGLRQSALLQPGAGDNYQGAILEFWCEQFEQLQCGARVVDIATGNGAVALLALDAAEAAGIEIDITGVDLANIDPLHQVQDAALRERLGRIHFHPRTPAESLPFADASIDLACSQFGLEYSDTDASVAELARVGAAGAKLAMMIHHAQSLPLQATAEELAQLDMVDRQIIGVEALLRWEHPKLGPIGPDRSIPIAGWYMDQFPGTRPPRAVKPQSG